MKINFKKLHRNAVIPSYAVDGDAGMDLTAVRITQQTSRDIIYQTGLAVEIPKGYVGLIFPRSSIRKYDLSLSNSVGVIDSGYRGEIGLTFKKLDEWKSYEYKVGDRIGQLIVLPYPNIEPIEVEELNNSERGEKGFGSTGN